MSSIAWKFFTVNESDADYAVCKLCKKLIKRGNTPRTYATSPLLKHLAKNHEKQFFEAKNSLSPDKKATSSSPAPKKRKIAATSQASIESYRTIKR